MSSFVSLEDVKKIYQMGEVQIMAAAGIDSVSYTHLDVYKRQQFYKQMMVGVFDRVFETAPVFRAEKHNTKRHLNLSLIHI